LRKIQQDLTLINYEEDEQEIIKQLQSLNFSAKDKGQNVTNLFTNNQLKIDYYLGSDKFCHEVLYTPLSEQEKNQLAGQYKADLLGYIY